MARKTTEAIGSLLCYTTTSQLRSFWGVCIVYRRFIPGFAKVAVPLTQRLKKSQPNEFVLDHKEHATVDELKARLTSPLVIEMPRSTRQYFVDSDASGGHLGCVLSQDQEDKQLKPVAYLSRSCNVEQNYETTHKKCLAVVWPALTLRSYLERSHFVVRTNYKSLRRIWA